MPETCRGFEFYKITVNVKCTKLVRVIKFYVPNYRS
jgi:hypothetical protein